MKDLVRLRTSFQEEVEKILNEQIKMEARSSAIYLAMASWCERQGFENSANFLYAQAEDERGHMMKIFKYVNELGGQAVSPEIKDLPRDFDSFKGVFEQALEQEIDVTQSFHRILDTCYKNNDYTTVNFVQWFLKEQREEEFILRRCLELFDIIGEEHHGKYLVDKEIPNITYEEA